MTRRRPLRLAPLFGWVSFMLTSGAGEHRARADEPVDDRETVDGVGKCKAFYAKNTKELRAWEKDQPPVPYEYPREKTFLNAPWAQLFSSMGHSGELLLATILPHVGAQLRGTAPAAYVGWPWSVLVLGPMHSCTRKRGTFVVHGHRLHRVLLEPAIVASNRGVGFSVRPGYRIVWHPSTWVVGPGLGLGSTLEIEGNQEPFRYSVGPEVLAHFGKCCRSSYFTLTLRYDHYFDGRNRDIVGGSLGYTFF